TPPVFCLHLGGGFVERIVRECCVCFRSRLHLRQAARATPRPPGETYLRLLPLTAPLCGGGPERRRDHPAARRGARSGPARRPPAPAASGWPGTGRPQWESLATRGHLHRRTSAWAVKGTWPRWPRVGPTKPRAT